MSRISNRGRRFLGIATCSAIAFSANCASAQITPDGTLPNNSIVTPSGNTSTITGGTQAGGNLFHSFQQFSVPTGGTAIFNNAVDIQNIISRVTGSSISNIDGLIKANGTANLFLINPNGIIFGRNASLNVSGSFVASTANALQFGNLGFFSATDKNIPSPLLTINPSALLFNQINQNAAIQNNSVADSGLNLSLEFPATGLRVPDGKSLLLVGGDINMDGGGLYAFGGRVELGGLAGAGIVGLNGDGNNLSLSFPDSVKRSDVFLSNGARVEVLAGNGGSIAVNARNLAMTGESYLLAGIESGLGSDNSKVGNIEVNAQGTVNSKDKSIISNNVQLGAKGKGGNISITTGSLSLANGAQIVASTFGQGDAGSVTISAQDKVSFNGDFTGAASQVAPAAVGKGGDVTITTGSLSLTNGAQLNADTYGQGNAGNVTISAQDTVSFNGFDSNKNPSGAFTSVLPTAVGKGGNISITTGSLSLTNGAQVFASTRGRGDAGSVTITARDKVSFDGVASNGNPSAAFSSVESGGVGKGSSISITTDSLFLTNGAQLIALTRGQGNAGSITITARDRISFDGVASNGNPSAAFSSVESGAVGKGSNINITADSLSLTNGAQLIALTRGQGDAGSITITARDRVSFDGVVSNGNPSVASSSVQPGAVGKGSSINITADSLSLTNGAQLIAVTYGQGDAGNITITAQDIVFFDGVGSNGKRSAAFSSVQPGAVGNGGDISIMARSLALTNGAAVTASSFGRGAAGNIKVASISIRLNNQAFIVARTASGNGGNIALRVRDLLLLRRGSEISTTAGIEQKDGDGGNITINTPSGFIVAVPNENSDITANAYTGIGGRVQINASGIYGTQFREKQNPQTSDITASSEFGVNGTVELNTPEIDPNSGLINLPLVPVDTKLAQGCNSPNYAQSSFIVTGRGGLPPNPRTDLLTPDAVEVDWVTLKPSNRNRSNSSVSNKPSIATPEPIVEATGWMRNEKGEVVLTANAPTITPHESWQKPAPCRAS